MHLTHWYQRLAILFLFILLFQVLCKNSYAQTGGILREVWTGISGTQITSLTSHPKYPNTPDVTEIITTLEAPVNWAQYYGTRIRGYLHPPVTGYYTFWIAGDDYCDLYLSADATEINKQKISEVPGWTSFRNWYKYPQQQSVQIYLTAGQKYYIEVLQKEHS